MTSHPFVASTVDVLALILKLHKAGKGDADYRSNNHFTIRR